MEIKKNTSLKQIVEEYNKQQDYIEKLRKEFENYLNKEEIHKIIKTSLTNNIRLENYYEDFFIFLKPEQFGQFSGGPDGYSITIGYKGGMMLEIWINGNSMISLSNHVLVWSQ